MQQLLFFLSPAKKMNLQPFQAKLETSLPVHLKSAQAIMKEIMGLSGKELEKVMAAKGKLIDEVVRMHNQWGKNDSQWPAAALYNGDAYTRLAAREWSIDTWNFAQNHLVILSGLYGWLKPLDLIQPYRLMVGAPWKNMKGQSLYDYWSDKINSHLNEHKDWVGIMTASKEYAQMIPQPNQIQSWIYIDFKVEKNGEYVSVSSFSKQARGEMVRLAMEHKISNLNDLKSLEVLDFSYNSELSDEQNWIYVKSSH